MYRILCALVLAVTLTATAQASPPLASDIHVDRAYGVGYVKERVVSLPQDQDKPYLTVMGNPADVRYKQLVGWFNDHETLKSYKSQTHFNTLATNGKMYRERYAESFPDTPGVYLQTADGTSICEFKGNDLPLTPDALARAMTNKVSKTELRCPRKNKQRQVEPDQVDPDPAVPPLPPVAPRPAPNYRFPWVILGILTAVGAGAGVAKQWRDTYYGKKS